MYSYSCFYFNYVICVTLYHPQTHPSRYFAKISGNKAKFGSIFDKGGGHPYFCSYTSLSKFDTPTVGLMIHFGMELHLILEVDIDYHAVELQIDYHTVEPHIDYHTVDKICKTLLTIYSRPRGCKTFVKLNTAQHANYSAHKC